MKIRIEGSLKELSTAQGIVKSPFKVLEISKPYKNRGDSEIYRIYITSEANGNDISVKSVNKG